MPVWRGRPRPRILGRNSFLASHQMPSLFVCSILRSLHVGRQDQSAIGPQSVVHEAKFLRVQVKSRLAGELGEERGQDVLFVAPDEADAPLRIMARRRQFQGARPLLHALVDGPDGLKGQFNTNRSTLVSVRVVLTVPDKFGHF